MDSAHWLLLFWTVIVFYVLGGIWFVQIVVYPLFGKVGQDEYVAYHKFYSSRIPLPVILPGFASFLLPLTWLSPSRVGTDVDGTRERSVWAGGAVRDLSSGDDASRPAGERRQAGGGGDPRADPLQLASYPLHHRLGHCDADDGHRCFLSRVARTDIRW
jgi:hypothetical protein